MSLQLFLNATHMYVIMFRFLSAWWWYYYSFFIVFLGHEKYLVLGDYVDRSFRIEGGEIVEKVGVDADGERVNE